MNQGLTKLGFLLQCCILCFSLQSCSEDKNPTPTESPLPKPTVETQPAHVGGEVCASCHQNIFASWKKSHHAQAMQEANEKTVLGDFDDSSFSYFGVTSSFKKREGRYFVKTDGSEGKLQEFEIKYTFGITPLQQYLIEFPGGRYQALGIAWDSRTKEQEGQRWFHLYPDEKIEQNDELHWTGPNQNWNNMCAECHSTNLQKNYSIKKDQYETTWADINVTCEACHGPGSQHVAWAKGERINEESETKTMKGFHIAFPSLKKTQWRIAEGSNTASRVSKVSSYTEMEACARCHSRRSTIHDVYEHGQPLLQTHLPSLLDQGRYHADGQIQDEVYVYGSFLQSKMYQAGVTCSDCHQSHNLQLREIGNGLCTRCHRAEHFDQPTHHFHKAESEGAQCINCHMPAKNFMVIDPRRDHSIRIPRPDLSMQLGTPNACNQCHKKQSAQWATKAIKKWYGEHKEAEPHFGKILKAGREDIGGSDAALMKLAIDTNKPGIVRATAFSLLRRFPSLKMVEALRTGVKDKDPLVRIGAARSLEVLEPEHRYELGKHLLNDPIRAVRTEAGRYLAAVQTDALSPNQQETLNQAIEEYIQSQLVNAERPSSHLNLGIVHVERGKFVQAEKAYRTALRLDTDFYPALVNLADLYRLQKRDKEGMSLLEQAIQVAPNDASVHHALGLLLVRTGQKDEAMPPLKQAWELQPESPRYGYVYGIALNSSGKITEAIKVLEETLERRTNDPQILLALMTMHRDHGNQKSATLYAKRLQSLSTKDPRVQTLLQQLQSDGQH